jgi:drug/metabolite transporter (DMT)-like permease
MALAGAVFGCYLTVGGYRMQVLSMNHAGIVAGIAAAVSFGWYSLQSEYGMRTYAPWTVLIYALLFASIIWNILHPPLEAFSGSYSAVSWCWIFFIAVFGTILPFGFFNKGIHLITATHASITATAEPITAAIISYLFLNETMQPLQMAGAVMVICAIILLQMKKKVH